MKNKKLKLISFITSISFILGGFSLGNTPKEANAAGRRFFNRNSPGRESGMPLTGRSRATVVDRGLDVTPPGSPSNQRPIYTGKQSTLVAEQQPYLDDGTQVTEFGNSVTLTSPGGFTRKVGKKTYKGMLREQENTRADEATKALSSAEAAEAAEILKVSPLPPTTPMSNKSKIGIAAAGVAGLGVGAGIGAGVALGLAGSGGTTEDTTPAIVDEFEGGKESTPKDAPKIYTKNGTVVTDESKIFTTQSDVTVTQSKQNPTKFKTVIKIDKTKYNTVTGKNYINDSSLKFDLTIKSNGGESTTIPVYKVTTDENGDYIITLTHDFSYDANVVNQGDISLTYEISHKDNSKKIMSIAVPRISIKASS